MLTRGSRNQHLTGLLDPVHIWKRVTIKSKYESFDYFVCRFTTPKITCSCVEFDDRFCSKSVQKLAGQYYLPFCHLTRPSKALKTSPLYSPTPTNPSFSFTPQKHSFSLWAHLFTYHKKNQINPTLHCCQTLEEKRNHTQLFFSFIFMKILVFRF